MSYSSSDPENLNRNPETSSLASVSTTASQQAKNKKKPWSKFKSGIKSIGEKMSSKPKFTEPTESSEQKRVKKSKKLKVSTSDDIKPSSSEEKPREKSPSKGPKGFIKKVSVETISTPFVGYQPSSISPTKTYAKTLQSGSTSESNLSTSDMDTPKKSLTLDKNTKFSLSTQDSPDSGRISQILENTGSLGGSRPPSQITEEGYVSGTQKEVVSDSDYTSPHRTIGKSSTEEVAFDSLVAKTEQFAQSLVSPKAEKEKDPGMSEEFIRVESMSKPPNPAMMSTQKTAVSLKTPDNLKNVKEQAEINIQDSKKGELNVVIKSVEGTKLKKVPEIEDKLTKSEKDEIEGPKKKKNTDVVITKTVNTNEDLIKSEKRKSERDISTRTDKNEDIPVSVKQPEKSEEKVGISIKVDEQKETSSVVKLETSDDNPAPITISETPMETLIPGTEPVKTQSIQETKLDKSEEKNKNLPESTISHEKDDINTKKTDIQKDLHKNNEPTESYTPTKGSQSPSEKATTSKTPATTLDSTSPFSSVGHPSPKTERTMSVEEKLEAFLSAEGWSATIKDVTVKSSADGSQQPDKRECLYKILVIGELGTGKTSIIKRYVHQFFSQHYRATIGVDFALKVLNWDPNTIIRLQLWDIAGQERFGNMTRVYYKEAVGAFIVFDVTRSATFDAVLKWKQDLDSKVQLADGSPIPCVLLANKCDQQKEGIVNTPSKMDEYCKENNFSSWFETSAKENINIDEAAKCLVTQILQNDKMSQNGRDSARDSSKFPLDGKSEEEGRSCAC